MKDLQLNSNAMLPLRDVVFQTLREAILTGDIEPGERLMEIHLSNQLGVSRTPIREAIRKLELEGLVVMTPRKGAIVASITEEDLKEVLEVRVVLEMLAMELACKKINGEQMDGLKRALKEFQDVIDLDDPNKIASKDEAFHDCIYQATGNSKLMNLLNNLREQMYRYRVEYIKDISSRHSLVEEHILMIEALEKRDIASGTSVIKTHILNQQERIIQNLRKEKAIHGSK